VMWVRWNLVSVRLETVFESVQDRCMVCAKHTIGSEIILDILYVSVQDRCMVCAKNLKGSEIVLDTPDGTPR
jgi:hypothetical protein